MPKGIGYQDASKLSAFRRKKSEDEKSLKKNKATKDKIEQLRKSLSEEDIRRLLDKRKK